MSLSKSKLFKTLLLMSAAVLLSHCGQKGYDSSQLGSTQAQTGYETEDGKKFVAGDEQRLEGEKIKILPILPVDRTPIKMTPEEEQKLEFHQTLKEFRFLRYENGSQNPTRLGQDLYTYEILLQEDSGSKKLLTFSGGFQKVGSQLRFQNSAKEDSAFSITGQIEDQGIQVTGEMILTRNNKGLKEEATILYRAYEANLNIRTPSDKNVEEHVNLFKKIEELRNNTKAWVNTFVVPHGVSTYDVAIIQRTLHAGNEEKENPDLHSLLQFSGRSVETGVEGKEEEKVIISPKTQNQNLEQVLLIGNAEGEDSKIFSVVMTDDNGEETQVLMDLEREKTQEEILEEKKKEEELRENFLFDPVFEGEDKEEEESVVPAPQENINIVLPPDHEIPNPTPRPEHTPTPVSISDRDSSAPTQKSLGNNEKSYMYARSGANALKIVRDFEKNFSLRGVQKEINAIKNSRPKVNQLKAFFKYANPFRGMIEDIAKTYQVPPQYAYVALIESSYFYGGKYKIEVAPTTTASGPFQFVIDTARGLGMRVDRSQRKGTLPSQSDERRYFAPSACAAAKYFRNNAKMFRGDATLSITGYYRGENRINTLAKRYGYSFAELARHNVEKVAIEYTNKKLAAYFMAGKYEGSSLDVDSQSPKQLPGKTVFPSQGIKDNTCKNAIGR